MDTTTASASATLLSQTSLCGIVIQAYVPRIIVSLAAVIGDPDPEHSIDEVTNILHADVGILCVHSFGSSSTVCVPSQGRNS